MKILTFALPLVFISSAVLGQDIYKCKTETGYEYTGTPCTAESEKIIVQDSSKGIEDFKGSNLYGLDDSTSSYLRQIEKRNAELAEISSNQNKPKLNTIKDATSRESASANRPTATKQPTQAKPVSAKKDKN